jgi:lipoprotein NlpI
MLLLAAADAYAQTTADEPQCGAVTGNAALAVEVCTRAIGSGRYAGVDLAGAYYSRGTALAGRGDHEQAIDDYNVAIQLDPNMAVAYFNRALSWAHNGDPDRAIADYSAVLRLNPRDGSAYMGRAGEWIVKGDFNRAIADYGEAVRVDPNAAAPFFGRGRAKFYAGEFAPAGSDFIRAHQLEGGIYTALWLYLARKRADIPGEKTLAQEAGTGGGGDWPAPVVALYLGAASPEAVQQAAAHRDPARQRDQRCEANFYIGQWQVLRGAREAAIEALRAAQSGCPQTFIEHEGAAAELRRLQKP